MLQYIGRNGVLVEGLTPQLGDYFGTKNGEGVLVRSVEKGSPGEAAGLRAGDVIVRVGEDRIADTGDWRRATSRNRGKTVQLNIIRDKREQTLSLTVPARAQASGVPESWDFDFDSFDVGPELARANREMSQRLRQEYQAHRKDYERAQREATQDLQRSMREHRKEMEQLQRDMQQLQQQLHKDLMISFHEPL
jgi:C-terminal processing protease CtpA/Prc